MLAEAGEGIGAAKGSPDFSCVFPHRGLPGGSVVENPPANSGDLASVPGSGRSPEGHGDPLQYSGLGELHRQTSLVGYRPRDCREPGGTEPLALCLSHTSLPRARLGASQGLSFPPNEGGDYRTYQLSMNLGDKGTVVPTSHDRSLLVTSRIPPGPTGPLQAGDLNLWQDLCVDPCAPHLTLKEAPPTAQSKEVPPSAAPLLPPGAIFIFPGRTSRPGSTARLSSSLSWLGPGRGRCQAWQGDGGEGEGRGPGTHRSLEPASLGFQDNLREGKGRHWAPVTGL